MIYEVIIALMILQVTRELFLKMKRKERLCLCFPGEECGRHSFITALQTHFISMIPAMLNTAIKTTI